MGSVGGVSGQGWGGDGDKGGRGTCERGGSGGLPYVRTGGGGGDGVDENLLKACLEMGFAEELSLKSTRYSGVI
jgi:hypothetical protein